MAATAARERLFDYLDRHVFHPVLEAAPDDYAATADKDKLQRVKRAIREARHRYLAECPSAAALCGKVRDDLSSQAADALQRDLADLGLPGLGDAAPGFESLCRELGVEA